MWKKSGCQQQRIEYKWSTRLYVFPGKSKGQIEMAVGIFSVFLIAMVMMAGLKIAQFMITGAYVEDALAASNLASALIDVEEFGRSRVIRVADPIASYRIYKEALAQNLMLEEDGRSLQRELLEGDVEVTMYIIYNVDGDRVQVLSFFGESAQPEVEIYDLGQVYTPDGVLIETTTIYSRVKFQVRGIGQVFIRAEKEKSIDIKREIEHE